MKSTIRIASPAPYEYIELEVDGTASDIISKYFEMREKLEARWKEVTKDIKKEEW